jgi:hypothetical protein
MGISSVYTSRLCALCVFVVFSLPLLTGRKFKGGIKMIGLRSRSVSFIFMSLAIFCWAGQIFAQCPTPEFGPLGNFAAGQNPSFVTTGDFNRDEILDLAVANFESNTVSILLGQGNGSISGPVNFQVGRNPRFIATGDLNNDGFLDLAVANFGSANISILLGHGNGQFEGLREIRAESSPSSIVLADLNGDNILDLVIANESTNSVSVLLGRGTGLFRRPVDFSVGTSPTFIITGDFNKDGFIDIAVANELSNSIAILLGAGNGTFDNIIFIRLESGPRSIALGDFDRDGLLDLAVVSQRSNRIFIMLGLGDGSSTQPVSIEVGANPSSIAAGDFNGDGFLDLAVTNSGSGNISIMFGRGDGTFCPPTTFTSSVSPVSLVVVDFDRDGKTDLVVVNVDGTVSVVLNTSRCSTINLSTSGNLEGAVGESFNQTIFASGGTPPFTFSVLGNTPPGLVMTSGGAITGTPTAEGNFIMTVRVLDTSGCETRRNFVIRIRPRPCPTITLTGPSLTNLSVGEEVEQLFAVSGGTGPFTFRVTGRIPAGLSLSTDGILSGRVTESGTFNFIVKATDANGCSSNEFRINLNITCPSITVNAPTIPNLTVGAEVNQSFTVSGGTGPFTFSTNGGLPTGLSLSSEGTLSGTVTGSGTFSFTVTATDSFGCSSASVPVTISVSCPAITITGPTTINATAGNSLSQSYSASGGTGPFTFNASGFTPFVPAGVTLSAGGTFSGTPITNGTFNFTVTATDANGCAAASLAVTLVVNCPQITFSPETLPPATVGVAYDQTITISGATFITGDNDVSLNFPLSIFALGNGNTVRIAGTPTVSGTFTIRVEREAAIGGCRTSQAFTLQINPFCTTITISPTTLQQVTFGADVNQSLSATGGSGQYTFTLAAGSELPSGLSLSAGGAITGTVTGVGNFFFTVNVTDNVTGCTGSQQVNLPVGCATITVSPSTLPTVTFGTTINLSLTATGGAGNYTFTLIPDAGLSGLPAGVTLNSNGSITGTVGGAGNFFFRVRATDPNGCSGETVINLPVGCPTITISGPTTINATTSNSINVIYSASGGSGAYTFSAGGTLPPGVSFSSNGTLSGVPTQTGTFTINVTATDSNNCASASLSITIVVE